MCHIMGSEEPFKILNATYNTNQELLRYENDSVASLIADIYFDANTNTFSVAVDGYGDELATLSFVENHSSEILLSVENIPANTRYVLSKKELKEMGIIVGARPVILKLDGNRTGSEILRGNTL